MSRRGGFYRVLHWHNVNGEAVNLAIVVYGDGFDPVWRTLSEWSRASAFADWPEADMRESVEMMITEMGAWSILQMHSQWRHEMSILQLTEARPTMLSGQRDIEKTADGIAESFLFGGGKPLVLAKVDAS